MKCPHCGFGAAHTTAPDLMGHPVLICAGCKSVALARDWLADDKKATP